MEKATTINFQSYAEAAAIELARMWSRRYGLPETELEQIQSSVREASSELFSAGEGKRVAEVPLTAKDVRLKAADLVGPYDRVAAIRAIYLCPEPADSEMIAAAVKKFLRHLVHSELMLRNI